MARRRRARGLLLNYPEAVALITDEMMELAREGRGYGEVSDYGQHLLTTADVLPGVAVLARGLVCEPMFDDGARIIVLADPIAGEGTERPGRAFPRRRADHRERGSRRRHRDRGQRLEPRGQHLVRTITSMRSTRGWSSTGARATGGTSTSRPAAR